MRIRSTKPEFWRSRRIASVSWNARLVLKGLESYVDDNGVGKDDLESIVGDVFPRDLAREGSRVLARVSEAVSELHHAGLVHRYEVDGDELLFLSWWDTTQRIDKPGKGRLPRPDGTWDYKASLIREPLARAREESRALAPGTGEQGNRGTGEEPPCSTADAVERDSTSDDEHVVEDRLPPGFADFWDTYPRRIGKADAVKAWKTARRTATAATIVAGARRYRDDPNLPDAQYQPYPGKWLRAGRWDDGPLPARSLDGSRSAAEESYHSGVFAAARERAAAAEGRGATHLRAIGDGS